MAKRQPKKKAQKKAPEEEVIGAGYDNTVEWNARPEKDVRYDVSLVVMDPRKSKKGNPCLVAQFVIDTGDYAGTPLADKWYVLGLDNESGERQLKSLGVATGFRFEGGLKLKDYAKQWVDHDDPLRCSILLKYEYALEQEGGAGWVNNVTEEEYNEHDGPKSIKLIPVSFKEAQNDEPDIELTTGEQYEEEEPDDEDFDDDDFDPDDETPF